MKRYLASLLFVAAFSAQASDLWVVKADNGASWTGLPGSLMTRTNTNGVIQHEMLWQFRSADKKYNERLRFAVTGCEDSYGFFAPVETIKGGIIAGVKVSEWSEEGTQNFDVVASKICLAVALAYARENNIAIPDNLKTK